MINDYFGRTAFGELQIVLTYVTVYWLLTDFGLNAVVVRHMAAEPDREQEYLGGLISLRTILSLGLALVSGLVLLMLPYSFEIKLAAGLGIFTIFTQGIKGAIHGLFQTRLRYDLQLIESLIGSIVYLGLVYWLTRQDYSLFYLVGAFVAGQVTMTLVSIYFTTRLARFQFNFNPVLLKQLAIATLPFGISLLFNLGNFKLDSFLLSILRLEHYANADAVGIYNVAYKFFEFALIVPTFLMNALYPVLIKSFEDSLPKFRRLFWQSGLVLLTIAVGGMSLTFVLAPWMISLVGSLDEYQESVTVLKILIAAAPVFFLSSLLMWTVLVFKDQKVLIKIYAAAFLVNLTLNLWLIPEYGFYGAAATTGVSELLILILLAGHIYAKFKEQNSKTKA